MTETWRQIREFPEYEVSDEGRVRHYHIGNIKARSINAQGVLKVGLYADGRARTRSVAVMVARAFVPGESEIFNTPMHLDGDRNNCRADNIMWRPRWYAIKFHRQFWIPEFHNSVNVAIEDVESGQRYPTVKAASIATGIHYNDLYRSYIHGDPTPFGRRVFRVVKER